LVDFAPVQREQAAAPEWREGLLHVGSDARRSAVDLDRPQGEDRRLACAEIGEGSSAEERETEQ